MLLKYITKGSKGRLHVPPKHLPSWDVIFTLLGSFIALTLSITLPLSILNLNIWANYNQVFTKDLDEGKIDNLLSSSPDSVAALVCVPSHSSRAIRHQKQEDNDHDALKGREILPLHDLRSEVVGSVQVNATSRIGHPSRWYVEHHQQRIYVNLTTLESTTGAPTFYEEKKLSEIISQPLVLGSIDSINIAKQRYESYNQLTVAQPTVMSSIQKHFATSPLALIQVSSSMLHLLEDEPQRALWSILSKFFYYYNHARQSVRNARELAKDVAQQDDEVSRISVKVLRPSSVTSKKGGFQNLVWQECSARDVLPGDVVAINANFGETQSFISSSTMVMPFDALLLEGNVVCNEAVLTGESVPQSKLPPDVSALSKERRLNLIGNEDRSSILYAGTTLLYARCQDGDSLFRKQNEKHIENRTVETDILRYATPSGYVRCLALRTGSYSSRGALIRSLNQEDKDVGFVGGGNEVVESDGLRILSLLSVIAVTACAYLVLDDIKHDGFNLSAPILFGKVITCSRIWSTAVPTDLSLMVFGILKSCSQYLRTMSDVVCSSTSPGALLEIAQANTVVFDKTGTLTADTQEMDKIISNPMDPNSDYISNAILGACHSLVQLKKKGGVLSELVGDPLEKSAVSFSSWKFDSKRLLAKPKQRRSRTRSSVKRKNDNHVQEVPELIYQLRSFPFDPVRRISSALLLVVFGKGGRCEIWQTVKGAPDAIRGLVYQNNHPENSSNSSSINNNSNTTLWFDNTVNDLSFQGKRVIAMAYSNVTEQLKNSLLPDGLGTNKGKQGVNKKLLVKARDIAKDTIGRDNLETIDATGQMNANNTKYILAGLGSFSASVRPSSPKVVQQLKEAGFHVCMLTGDGIPAALAVAVQTNVISKSQIKRGVAILDVQQKISSGKSSEGSNLVWSIIRLNESSKKQTNSFTTSKNKRWFKGKNVQFSLKTAKEAFRKAHGGIVASGGAMDLLLRRSESNDLSPGVQYTRDRLHEINIVARATPAIKEKVVAALKEECDKRVIMCGDGVNDVSAMQTSDVAFAMLSGFGSEANSNTPQDADEYRRRERFNKRSSKILTLSDDEVKLQEAGVGTSSAASAVRVRKMLNDQLKSNSSSPSNETPGLGRTLRAYIVSVREEQKRLRLLQQGGASAAKILAEEEALRQSILGTSTTKRNEDVLPAHEISPGEACLTADFTILNPSISGVEATIRSGLVAAARTLHAHQELVLECIMSCYNLALLYRDHVRYGKWMWPIESFVYSATQKLSSAPQQTSRPTLPELSVRPPTSFFHLKSFVTVAAQAIMNLYVTTFAVSKAKNYESTLTERRVGFHLRPRTEVISASDKSGGSASLFLLNVISKAQQLAGRESGLSEVTTSGKAHGMMGRPPFRPNLVTNTVFILSIFQSLLVSTIQHRGFPFYQDFTESLLLSRFVYKTIVVLTMLLCETVPWANKLLGMAPWPQQLKRWLLVALFFNAVGCFIADAMCQRIWMPEISSERLRQEEKTARAPLTGAATAEELEDLTLFENRKKSIISAFRTIFATMGCVLYSEWTDRKKNAGFETNNNITGYAFLFLLLQI